MRLTQLDFEKRSLLEMLDFASNKLQKHIYFSHRKHYRYLFTHNGRPIKSLRDITPDMRLLVVSENPQFLGLFSHKKTVDFDEYVLREKGRVKGERMSKVQIWYSNNIKRTLPLKSQKSKLLNSQLTNQSHLDRLTTEETSLLQADLEGKLCKNELFITTVNSYLDNEIDPSFMKLNAHSAWDIALSSNEYDQQKRKIMTNSINRQQRALS